MLFPPDLHTRQHAVSTRVLTNKYWLTILTIDKYRTIKIVGNGVKNVTPYLNRNLGFCVFEVCLLAVGWLWIWIKAIKIGVSDGL